MSTPDRSQDEVARLLERVYREDRSRVLAALIRLCDGDFTLAEDALQDALLQASRAWESHPPDNPSGWVLTAARRRVIDTFYERLHPGGYLLLGHSESLLNTTTAFELVHLQTDMVYRRPIGSEERFG